MKLRICRFLALGLVALGLSSATAGAAMISFSHVTAPSATPFTDNFTLAAFDPTLGTLTGVTITLAATINSEVDVFNTSSTPYTFMNAFSSVPVTLTNPDGSTTTVTAMTNLASGLALPQQVTRYPGMVASSTGSRDVAAANLGEYVGSGANLSFAANFMGANFGGMTPQGTPGGTLFFGGSATAGGITTITYTYTLAAIPEPSSLALVGLGVGTVGAVARRRSARPTA